MNALAWALLDFVWQGALLGCAAAAVLALMDRARPQARYALACAALLLCAALPLAGVLARLGGVEAIGASVALPGVLLPHAAGPASAAGLAQGLGAGAGAHGWLEAMRLGLQPRLPLVILCWAGGAGMLALRLLLGLAWVRRRSRPGAWRPDPAWQAVLDRMAACLGIGRRVLLGLVDDGAAPGALIGGPVTAGWWRPLVLVPAALATGMAPPLLEALLAHELAHVRRHDYLINLMQSAVEVLLFYHPAVWWLSHRIRIERELIADDLAASLLGEPRRLALALSELDQFQLSTHSLAPAAHGGNLMSRIKRLVRPQSDTLNGKPHWKLALPLLALVLSAAASTRIGSANAAPQQAQAEAAAAQAEAAAAQAQAAASRAQAQAQTAAGQARAAARDAERSAGRRHDERFALVSGTEHNLSASGDVGDWANIRQLRRSIDGEFLWFRADGKSWVVQDPKVLAQVHAAYEPMERLGRQMEGYGKEMGRHGKAMDALGKDMSHSAADIRPDQARLHDLQSRMNDLGRQMGDLGRQIAQAQDDGERQRLQTRMNRLSAQMNTLGTQMGEAADTAAQHAARQKMDEIGRRMDEAGKPMDALGKQMDALGQQMEREGERANAAVRALIRDAMARGLARPAPQG
ncbi:M56 family metallopeptidase [Herbaspirillum sp. SJZ107]|uniref:M56 family metallopeptidase n=1 Tax=Herbaspirillum sp. SJZ107 TaxID=2572881 RepID=UPI0011519D03|nr:M56 family metallopeptidase [Herbaspirillum sp. SJZ107]TQK02797.1 BlaR1 peptidase M56 [Herbaspirillum sp. SJZ107]